MRRDRAFGVAIAVAAALGVVLAAGEQVPATYGYLLFTPSGALSPSAPATAEDLLIRSCDPSPEGLEVTGSVRVLDAPVEIAVTPYDPTEAGVRVGVAFAEHAQLSPGAMPGDFHLVIPWATPTSRFTLPHGGSSAGISCPTG